MIWTCDNERWIIFFTETGNKIKKLDEEITSLSISCKSWVLLMSCGPRTRVMLKSICTWYFYILFLERERWTKASYLFHYFNFLSNFNILPCKKSQVTLVVTNYDWTMLFIFPKDSTRFVVTRSFSSVTVCRKTEFWKGKAEIQNHSWFSTKKNNLGQDYKIKLYTQFPIIKLYFGDCNL